MGCKSACGRVEVSHFFCKCKPFIVVSLAFTLFGLTFDASAKPDQGSAYAKSADTKAAAKIANDKDVVLGKNAEKTLYLLSGWGKAEGPYMWFTVSAHFNKDQTSPDGKPFNLFSASGAVDCKENTSFYYRTSYMFFDAKAGVLNEVYFEKNKSNLLPIDSGSIEGDVQYVICK
jgi:hypothetical protein